MRTIQLRSRSNPPQVILTGYYNPVSPVCAEVQTAITPAEIEWITTQTTALNQRIQDVADRYEFVDFAPVDFTEHDLCSSDSWVQGLSDTAPAHPTAEGQQAIAAAVIAKLNN
jgi:lysophospholipase L1-like esterase